MGNTNGIDKIVADEMVDFDAELEALLTEAAAPALV